LDVWDQSPDGPEANRPRFPDEKDGSRCHPRRSCTHAWEGRCGILDGDQICSQRSVFLPKGSHPSRTPDVERSPVDEAILTALAEFPFPFSSVRGLLPRICLPRSTVYRHRHLTQSLRFTVRHLRWAPHFLTAEQKQIRVQMAI
jgi:hypothetical protein